MVGRSQVNAKEVKQNEVELKLDQFRAKNFK